MSKAFGAVAAHARPAVVSVYSEKTVKFQSPEFSFPFGDDFFQQFFGQQFQSPRLQSPKQGPKEYSVPQRGMGSGMILDKEGHILTNYHVVKDVDEIKVQLADKQRFEAEIIGSDPKTDIAVIRIKGHVPSGLPTLQLGDSDAVQVGELVMAIGAPFGLTQTVTTGIISAKGRSDVGITDYEDFLQTDAPINPGNSGGPLVNMSGDVIGMNSAIATSVGQFAGVGFAIPANMIKSLLPTLLKGGKITRGQLGVVIQDISPELAKQFNLPEEKGALVSQVNPGSPASKAGIKTGDVIVRFDGKEIENTRDLRNRVAAITPGTKLTLGIMRDGKPQTLSVVIGEAIGEPIASAGGSGTASSNQLSKLGLTVQDSTPVLEHRYGITGGQGVIITAVEEGSPSALAGLQEGDLIVEANRQPVPNTKAFQSALASNKDKDNLLLLIKRKDASLFVILPSK